MSPAFITALDILDEHGITCELLDEEESKDKVLFQIKSKSGHDKHFTIQEQSSICLNRNFSDFKPEVPIPPPKQV